MKVMKLALLGTAALAAASLTARADDLSDLKAQIEALNSRIATLESAPSVPAGYQLLTMSKAPAIVAPGEKLGPNDLAMNTTIAILPTADVPASTNVQWTGKVVAGFVYYSTDGETSDGGTYEEDSTHILASTELNLKATTDTAVGEVGVFVRMKAAADGHDNNGGSISRYYGWWKMTPELSLKAGYKDSIGGIGHGNDSCSCNYNSYLGAVGGSDDSAQFELRYASGPVEAAIAVEHHDDYVDISGDNVDEYIVAGEVKFAGDSMSAEVAGFFGDENGLEVWNIGAGATFSMDMFSLSAAAGIGERGSSEGWEASLFATAALSDSISAELGVGVENYDLLGYEEEYWGVAGGIYWSPVDKLTIGAEASWVAYEDNAGNSEDNMTAALVTVFKF